MIRLLLLPWNILPTVFLVTPFIVLFVLQKCTFRFADHTNTTRFLFIFFAQVASRQLTQRVYD